MKIAVFEPYISGFGGAQKVITKYCSYLQSKTHQIEIFTQKYEPEKAYTDFKKFKINLIKPSNKNLSFLAFSKKFNGFDFYISNDFPSNFISIKNKPSVWICYSPKRDFYDLKDYFWKNVNFAGKIFLSLKKLLFKNKDFSAAKKTTIMMPISKTVQQRIKKYYQRKTQFIFYPGIDFQNYESGKQKNYFLYVSRLVNHKRVDLAIKAMNFVRNKQISLYIVGEGPEKENLERLAKTNSKIKFFTALKDKELKKLYSNCLGVIFVPINEDWGLIPLEAAASEKPVIGVNEGGLKETIINKETGFLLNEVSPKKIAEKIDYLYKNKKIAKKMGIKAKKFCSKFDWRNLLPDFENVLKSSFKKR